MRKATVWQRGSSVVAVWAMWAAAAHAGGLPALPPSVPVTDLPSTTFRTPATINGWIAQDRRDLMKAHAWDLFAAVMAPRYDNAGATVRLFDTWHSLDEAVPVIGSAPVGFGSASNGPARANAALQEAMVSDVKYNPPIGRMVENALALKLTAANGRAVVAGYKLKDQVRWGQPAAIGFTDTRAVMLKPAFTIIKGTGPTVIARWEESIDSTNPASVDGYKLPANANRQIGSERTWTKTAVVYPTTASSWPATTTYYGRDGMPIAAPYNLSTLPKFNLTDFHWIKLNQAQVDSLRTGILKELMGPNTDHIEVGDYAVLTSMHIATREIDTWTWQTFWWQPVGGETLSANGASAAVQALIGNDPAYKPLKHFRGGVGYSMTDRAGRAIIASNPYLEGSFGLPADLASVFGPGAEVDGVNVFIRDASQQALTHGGTSYTHAPTYGLRTNCLTCHTAAAYPPDSLGTLPAGTEGTYPDWGTLKGSEALFINRVRTHFLWGVANKVGDREADLLAGIDLPAAPAAAWSFDGTGAAFGADDSGGGRKLSFTADTSIVADGVSGTALHLAGRATAAALTSAPVVDTSGSFSVAGWVRFDQLPNCWNQVMASQDGYTVSGFMLGLLAPCNGTPAQAGFKMPASDNGAAGGYLVTGPTTLTAGTWYHLVGVRNTADQSMTLYVNGARAGKVGNPSRWSAPGAFVIGRAKVGGQPQYPVIGSVDGLRAYGRALTDDEVTSLYHGAR